MTLSRRQFLVNLVAAVGGGVSATALYGMIEQFVAQQPQTLPTLETLGTGTVDEQVIATLVAMAGVFVREWGSTDHYADYYRWRAENLPGYHVLYRQFAAALNRHAYTQANTAYVDAKRRVQREALAQVFAVTEPSTPVGASLTTPPESPVEEGWWRYYAQYIVGETLNLFLLTNGYIMLGYDLYPSRPRGLDSYTQPPDGH